MNNGMEPAEDVRGNVDYGLRGASEDDPQLWRIGRNLYDLTPFLDDHPGGRKILEMQREFFTDATYAFEAHHLNQRRVRRMLAKYYVGPAVEASPVLSEVDGFYAEFRRRVHRYLHKNGGPGPTREGLIIWWLCLAGFFVGHATALATGSYWAALPLGIFTTLIGAYGHNWIHQPDYRHYAYCLDLIGLSSAQWFVIHLLRHHMFTNTPRDNHFTGTDPFMVVDPQRERNWLQRWLTPIFHPLALFFGIAANWTTHLLRVARDPQIRRFQISWGKLILPMWFVVYYLAWGWTGVGVYASSLGIASIWYFTIALANHNTAHSWDVDARERARDWGEAQLMVSADVGVNSSYLASARYVWLNYHTVHHLVPAVDQSHHPAIQRILLECCDEFDVDYKTYTIAQMYREMMTTFMKARLQGVAVPWRKLWSEEATPLPEKEEGTERRQAVDAAE